MLTKVVVLEHLGAVLRRHGAVLGRLEAVFGRHGAVSAVMWRSWGGLGQFWGGLGAGLGRSRGRLGASLGRSWSVLGQGNGRVGGRAGQKNGMFTKWYYLHAFGTHNEGSGACMFTKVYYLHASGRREPHHVHKSALFTRNQGGVQSETGGDAKSRFWGGKGCILIRNKDRVGEHCNHNICGLGRSRSPSPILVP